MLFILLLTSAVPARQLVAAEASAPQWLGLDQTSALLANGRLCFAGADPDNGTELWCVAADGTVMVKDIFPGRQGSRPLSFVANGAQAVFLANDGAHGYEPWVTDGTSLGTHLLSDLWPGSGAGNVQLYRAGSGWLISGQTSRGAQQIWRTDGTSVTAVTGLDPTLAPRVLGVTPSGTAVAYDLTHHYFWIDGVSATDIGSSTLQPYNFGTAAGEAIYFYQRLGAGYALFRASASGVDQVVSAPQPAQGFPIYGVGTRIFVVGSDGVTGNEAWYIDGTTATLVGDLIPGNNYIGPSITVLDDGSLALCNGTDVWRTNGATTTHITSGSGIEIVAAHGAGHWVLLRDFDINSHYFSSAWNLDDDSVTPLVGTAAAQPLCDLANGFFFLDEDSQLAFYDGSSVTTSGTVSPRGDAVCTDVLRFLSVSAGSEKLLRSDGVTLTTVLTAADAYRGVAYMIVPGPTDRFFEVPAAAGGGLYREHGTVEPATIFPGPSAGTFNGRVYFGTDPYGRELSYDDATGIHAVTTVAATAHAEPYATQGGVFYSTPSVVFTDGTRFVDTGDVASVVFATTFTDRSLAVTQDAIVNSEGDVLVSGLVPNAWAVDALTGRLWVQGIMSGSNTLVATDGTPSTTYFLANATIGTHQMVANLGHLTFVGDDGVLYTTDGGLQALPGPIGADALTVFRGLIYFVANDVTHGRELWRTGGDVAEFVTDINPGPGSSMPASLTVLGATLLFTADDGTHGSELWSTDGVNVALLADINPGVGSGVPFTNGAPFAVGHDLAFFAGSDGVSGIEPWATDGTAAGTRLLSDVAPDAQSSEPNGFTVIGDSLYFAAARPSEQYTMYSLALVPGSDTGSSGGASGGSTSGDGGVVAGGSTSGGIPPVLMPPPVTVTPPATGKSHGCSSSGSAPLLSALAALWVLRRKRR